MESLSLLRESLLSLLRENLIKDVKNLFRLKKETEAIKDRILRDIKYFLGHKEEESYYKLVRVSYLR